MAYEDFLRAIMSGLAQNRQTGPRPQGTITPLFPNGNPSTVSSNAGRSDYYAEDYQSKRFHRQPENPDGTGEIWTAGTYGPSTGPTGLRDIFPASMGIIPSGYGDAFDSDGLGGGMHRMINEFIQRGGLLPNNIPIPEPNPTTMQRQQEDLMIALAQSQAMQRMHGPVPSRPVPSFVNAPVPLPTPANTSVQAQPSGDGRRRGNASGTQMGFQWERRR